MASASIRWGIVGASTIARQRVIPAIRSGGGLVVGVHSSDAARGRAYAAEQAIPASMPTLEALLAGVDAIYISSVNEAHRDAALAAAAAGVHVLCEKPLALTLADADAMIAACRGAGVVLATNHHLRGNAAIRAMRAQLRRGAIGRPLFARVFNAGYLPDALRGWRVAAVPGAGVILDKLVHDVDTLRFVLDDEITQVSASRQNSGAAGDGVEDGVMGVLRFRSGLLAQFHDAFSTPGGQTGLELHGTDGSLLGANCLTGSPAGELHLRNAAALTRLELTHVDPYAHVVEAFMNAVHTGAPPACSGEDGRRSVAVALAALAAAQTGQAVDLEPS